MANTKRYWHHIWVRLRRVKAWYLIAGFIIFGLVSITSLRNNNLTAIHLRDVVTKTDKQNGDVEAALRNLQSYTYKHMNAQLSTGPNSEQPPIQLKYGYERLEVAEKNRVSAANTVVYSQAQSHCERLVPQGASGAGRVPCVEAYVAQHGVKENPIPDGLYKFSFVSPMWSPDLAGWSLVVTGVIGLLLIVRTGLYYWLKHHLKQHL